MKKSKIVVLSTVFNTAVITCFAQHPVEIESINGAPYRQRTDSVTTGHGGGTYTTTSVHHGFFWRMFHHSGRNFREPHTTHGTRRGGFGRSAHSFGG